MTDEKTKEELAFIRSEEVKDLLNEPGCLSFKYQLISVYKKLRGRKFLDVQKVRDELDAINNISIEVKDLRGTDTDLRSFNDAIAQLDAQRSRLSDLLSDAQNDYDAIDTWYKELGEIWIGKSKGKSADTRKGETTEILIFLTPERIIRKALLNSVKMKFNLMTSKIDAISREITIGLELRRNQT